jgi:hypothetical protein
MVSTGDILKESNSKSICVKVQEKMPQKVLTIKTIRVNMKLPQKV